MDPHRADLWEVDGERVHCLLCPHSCRISAGHVGVCGVRRNEQGTLIALTYGRVSSIAADPIEKKPVFHYRPGTTALSVGSVGCTMKCGHCQNWEISRAEPGDGMLRDVSPETLVALANEYGCAGLAFTYNEPVIWAEYVRDGGLLGHEAGLYTVMVTNGYISQAGLDYIADAIDVWRVDVKGMTDAAYRQLCRVPSVAPVLEMAERARRVHGMHVEVVTNVVPGINDDEEQLRSLAAWIAGSLGTDTPWHITRFFPYLEFADVPATPIPTLRRARDIGREEGLKFVYLGNVAESGGEDTVCPSCGETVIARDGFSVRRDRTRDGRCALCDADLNLEP